MNFGIDGWKAIFTYAIAMMVILGGLVFLWRAMDLPAEKRDQLILGAVIALIGGAAQFVFGAEVATRSARQSERATAVGSQQTAAATLAAINTTTTPPPETTI